MVDVVPNGAPIRAGRILIVDDEEPNRQLLSALLSAQRYSTIVARDGPSALELIARGGVDLVLLDVMMPGMDGMEVCRRIREELNNRDVTIVVVTALSDRDSRLRAKLAGANDFLVKPIDSYELSFRVENWMKLRGFSELQREKERLSERLERLKDWAQTLALSLEELASICRAASDGVEDPSLGYTVVNERLLSFAESLSDVNKDLS